MNKTNLSVAIVLLTTSSLSFAEEDTGFLGWSHTASVALTTDYIWRGVSQTNNDPAIQGAFDLSHESGLYLGAWGSNVEFGDGDTSMELDVYAGYTNATDLGGILPFALDYDIGVLRYEYTGSPDSDFTELYFGASTSPLENLNLSYYYYYGLKVDHTKPGEYSDMAMDYTLPESLGSITLLGHVGYYGQKDATLGDSYWDWKVGASKEIAGYNIEIAYTETDESSYGNNGDAKVVATISRELGADSNGGLGLPEGFETSASVALTTDYIWRGVSQTNNEPAIQGSFDVSHDSGPYIGVWASSYEFGDNASMEVNLYGGFSRDTDLGELLPFAVTYDLGVLRYEYTSASAANFTELYFGASASPLENLNLSYYYYYGLKIENTLPGGEYSDMTIDYTLPESLCNVTLLAHAGYYNYKNGNDNYWDWKAGVAKDFGAYNIEVAYTETDDSGLDNSSLDDGRAVATLSTTF
ncbi:MAG: hypothetical protein HFP81_05230 [Methylococcales symbiont of Hymedesmia sp. n. MRB-2018]|nr:MAG: hypothetical protein HFP78_05310 [Methylococcales symbiont of Hymedesmia sp. n. MRB-2018]KAF3983828.1 MAG: hypothetical protein HFP81_05230 [Methylococcales symbiont of Hymedesmia sp. n. MRB-2018]